MTINTITGTVESLSKDRHGIKVNGQWYNNKFKDLPTDVIYGQQVTLEIKDGKFWNKASGAVADPVSGGAPTATTKSNPTFQGKTFPVAPLAPERSIIRQNSLSHATQVANIFYGCLTMEELSKFGHEEIAEKVISIARLFEAYSAGDIEAVEMEAAESVTETLGGIPKIPEELAAMMGKIGAQQS